MAWGIKGTVSPISLLFQDGPEFSAQAQAQASYVVGSPVPLPLPAEAEAEASYVAGFPVPLPLV